MALILYDFLLLLVVCNYASSYFAVGETFGFSSMEEPSWSSSVDLEEEDNEIPNETPFERSEAESTPTPPTTTRPTTRPTTTRAPTTTRRSTTSAATTTVTQPRSRTTARVVKPHLPRREPIISSETDHGRGLPNSGEQDRNRVGKDRSLIVDTVTVFKNIVRSIQAEMAEVRESCEPCSSYAEHSQSGDNQAVCEESKAATSKMKQQLRELKTSVKGIETTLAQVTQAVNTIGVQMSGVQPHDCMDMFTRGQSNDGVFYLQPRGVDRPFLAFCDMKDGGGWTMIQRRQEGDSVDFDKGMGSYRRGFGDPNFSTWLGLDNVHAMLQQDEYELRVQVETYQGRRAHAYYSYFKLGGADENYVLSLGNYNGTAGDTLSFHNGLPFTTKDRDNDRSPVNNCAQNYHGGWWYGNCLYANLNGPHIGREETESSAAGIIWFDLTGYHSSLRYASMAIRPTV